MLYSFGKVFANAVCEVNIPYCFSVKDREPQAWNEVESDSNTKNVKAQTPSFIRKVNFKNWERVEDGSKCLNAGIPTRARDG